MSRTLVEDSRMKGSFKQKLEPIAKLKKGAVINLQHLHPDLKDMLVKQVKNTKRINWIANKGKYLQWKMKEFLSFVQEARIYKIQLMKNYQKNIIKDFEHITFIDLQYINLENNWITNCEAIVYINAPTLRWLNLKNNEIVEMKAFRKMTFSSFKSLRINLCAFITNFTELNNYNRHHPVVAKELIRNHSGSVFSERIKSILNRRKVFYEEADQQDKDSDSQE